MKERKLQEISYLKFGKELGTELVRVVQESTENLAICTDVSDYNLFFVTGGDLLYQLGEVV